MIILETFDTVNIETNQLGIISGEIEGSHAEMGHVLSGDAHSLVRVEHASRSAQHNRITVIWTRQTGH